MNLAWENEIVDFFRSAFAKGPRFISFNCGDKICTNIGTPPVNPISLPDDLHPSIHTVGPGEACKQYEPCTLCAIVAWIFVESDDGGFDRCDIRVNNNISWSNLMGKDVRAQTKTMNNCWIAKNWWDWLFCFGQENLENSCGCSRPTCLKYLRIHLLFSIEEPSLHLMLPSGPAPFAICFAA